MGRCFDITLGAHRKSIVGRTIFLEGGKSAHAQVNLCHANRGFSGGRLRQCRAMTGLQSGRTISDQIQSVIRSKIRIAHEAPFPLNQHEERWNCVVLDAAICSYTSARDRHQIYTHVDQRLIVKLGAHCDRPCNAGSCMTKRR